ncbi:MAG: response regulator transcription factor [Nitrosomonadales bacterium]|nr:response regulator transcription factor [Nitrosomonadales bacterium]
MHILIIDDHGLYRSGLRAAITANMPDAGIFEAGSIDDAMCGITDSLDAIVLDNRLPGLNGVEGITLLRKKWPLVPVLMLSSQNDPEIVDLAFERGASGFISKGDAADKIVAAINLILRGKFTAPLSESETTLPRLTPRQCEVLDLLCQGMSNKLIARRLMLTENTVRVHVQAVLGFLQVSSRSQAIVAARSRGLIG